MARSKVLKQASKRNSPSRRNRRRASTRLVTKPVGVSRGPKGILAGYGSPLQATYKSRNTPDGCIVSGFDLVTSFDIHDFVSYYMPANPLWWQGTRIAAQARAYQNYRPLKFIIHYRPQVGSTSELSMFIGTVWQGNSINVLDSIEPSLVTSPGGVYLPSWNDSMTHVQLGSHLPQRMFPVNDKHFTTVPFTVIARSSAGGPSAKAQPFPGRIFIEYMYEFRNAIGGQAILREPQKFTVCFGKNAEHHTFAILPIPLGSNEESAQSMMSAYYAGTYYGRVMDVSEDYLFQPFGINSEVTFNINGMYKAGDQYYPASDSAGDGNWNTQDLPLIDSFEDMDNIPHITMYATEYPNVQV